MHLLATALGLSLLGSCGGLLVASSLVMFPMRVRTRIVPWLVSYAVGALLGVAFLALLPEALADLEPAPVFGTLLAGIVGALLAFAAVEIVPGIRPFILAISSASLLYIAMSDLIPDLHRGELDANAPRQVLLIATGIGTIVLFERLVG